MELFGVDSFFGVEAWALIFVCVLSCIAGYIDAVAGGGGLISLPAYLFVGLPVHAAVATNKLGASMGTFVSTMYYLKSGYVDILLSLVCIPFAIAGSALGANLVLFVDDAFLRGVLLVILPITAFYVLRSKSFDGEAPSPYPATKTRVICVAVAFVVGTYDGFYGPGTGTFLLLALTSFAHLPLSDAAGVTKSINLTTNVSALAVFLFHGQILIPLGLAAGLFSIIGNWLGARTFVKLKGSAARPLIVFILVVMIVKVAYDMAIGS